MSGWKGGRDGGGRKGWKERWREGHHMCDFAEGGGTGNQAHMLQKAAAGLMKVIARHEGRRHNGRL